MLKISATFLDQISWDIPDANWGPEEWDRDFAAMKAIGIDTVVMIRSGLSRWTAFPCEYLHKTLGTAMPDLDLVDLYLTLAEKYGMKFFLGLYHSRIFHGEREIELNYEVAREAWARYGSRKAFQGWYLCQEISMNTADVVKLYADLGKFCKQLSNNLPVMISPLINGRKARDTWVPAQEALLEDITPAEHESEWRSILSTLQGAVDIVAFQDGHVDIFELQSYLKINKKLIEEYGMECWTNCETFDRDMPIRFLPIKWEKMLYKLRAAEEAGITRAITFEFSHFMSPNSVYAGAHGLYDRYREYLRREPK